MDLIEIGRVGRPHGLKGEIKINVEEHFEEDLLRASAVLIGSPPIPYFLETARGGGALIVKFEDLNSREDVMLLVNKPIALRAEEVEDPNPVDESNPFAHLIGFRISSASYELLGPILEIVEMPKHFLALIERNGKEFYIPLHEDLIVKEQTDNKILEMDLPEGLAE